MFKLFRFIAIVTDPLCRFTLVKRTRNRWLNLLVHLKNYRHRLRGYKYLTGMGVEIGAANTPAFLSPRCKTYFADLYTPETFNMLFPEIPRSFLSDVDILMNVDKKGLCCLKESSVDFLIMNHVLEHIANPMREIVTAYRILKKGGHFVISIPDKRCVPWDKDREPTTFSHLWNEYKNDVNDISPEHFFDLVRYEYPGIDEGGERWREALVALVRRRDHCHVWTYDGFKAFLREVFKRCDLKFTGIYESMPGGWRKEYFGLYQKTDD